MMFAQQLPTHWTAVHVDGNSMTMTAELQFDGVTQANTNLEIGMFSSVDGNCRATRRPIITPFGTYIYAFTFHGINGETYIPRIWNHATDSEVTSMTPPNLSDYPYHAGDIFGNAITPIPINFSSTTGETYVLNITPYTSGENDHFHLIASPVGTINVDAVYNLNSNTFDLYYFDQSNDPLEWINYNIGANQNPSFTTLVQNRGYLYANSGNGDGNDVVLTFTGTALTEASKTIDLDYDPEARLAGWNLIGNPFAVQANIDRTSFYTMNSLGTELEAASRNYVEPMEGIFVKATGEGESVTFTQGIGGDFNNGGSIKLCVSDSDGMSDVAYIRFGQGNSLMKLMLNPQHIQIYFPMNDANYAVVYANNMNEMPINFKTEKNGSYTLSFITENVKFSYLHLIDNKNDNDINLLTNPTYSFDTQATDYTNRFKLVFTLDNADD